MIRFNISNIKRRIFMKKLFVFFSLFALTISVLEISAKPHKAGESPKNSPRPTSPQRPATPPKK